ncbi:hypothetical protein CDAR_487011 [Caerostris darwini]|uniref:DUF6570 domain-containing protein n=1 Tax=Caerostris darwini TaxID=1538125 RepID=A0AAV4TFZ6_9ARAC|nr:hypothetical protein CDAR_487011 [Caerostris darwini]
MKLIFVKRAHIRKHIRKRNVPNLAANYGFRYPEKPFCLSELNDLEERLVALRIPFMQIRELGRDRQYGIKGSVTNVPNDLHKSVELSSSQCKRFSHYLREIEETSLFQIALYVSMR